MDIITGYNRWGKKLRAFIYLPSLQIYIQEKNFWRISLMTNIFPIHRFRTIRVLAQTHRKTKHTIVDNQCILPFRPCLGQNMF